MASFVETGTYLKFGEKPRANCKPVLWPVMVHRVLYPDVTRPQLNLFQRAVLGLIRARTVRSEVIAELTGLHRTLIKLILAQGVSNGWLVANADALTSLGERLLDDEDSDASNLKSGYLLQDAITGRFWPRLVAELRQIESTDPLAKYPEFMAERKTGKSIKPFLIAGSRIELPQLDHESLMRTYRDYREDFRSSQQLDQSSQSPKQVKLQGVQRLDDAPQPARIFVWIAADSEGVDLWSVKDPFELRDNAWWLQSSLQQMVERNSNLLRRLESLVAVPRCDNQSVEEWLTSLHKQTDLQVLIEYPWVERQPDLKRYIAALLVRKEKLSQGDSGEHEMAAAIMECQKLLEVVMQWLIRTYPAEVGQLPKQQRHDHKLNQRILSALKIPAFTEDVIRLLSRQKIDQVVRACSCPSDSLKTLLFAAAVGVLSSAQHPLKMLSDQELQLATLLELADLRNQSSHGQSSFTGKTAVQLTTRMALDSIQYALSFTARFKEWM
ncbi:MULTISPECIES: hypothetical protein [Pseudomonas]|jgi:hypothetical protein|uniref:hypothetical protein n=1 Tax=Pseudomonas TaxID=286 RepID=UPI0014738C1B|nr:MULTISPECIES: hypothetical protein [Pseudomonas]MBJ2211675.1 hypothetical protein [Pseudomonas carnis]NMX89813.1 hypothetical protein [Pseudomonas sp. WS 5086]NMY44080.1 hypothetical protein [Pseudomonas sp. WS 5027]